VQSVADQVCTKVGSGSVTERSALEEHDVYSLAVFISSALRRSAMWCGVDLHAAPDGAE